MKAKPMELQPDLAIDTSALAALCEPHGVRRLALFGSTSRDDFNDESDIDFLVEFLPEHQVGMLEIARLRTRAFC
jgi:uncharacterized protein